nr:hypothetical protein BaRGS_030601 [Batillaria attramentaria]
MKVGGACVKFGDLKGDIGGFQQTKGQRDPGDDPRDWMTPGGGCDDTWRWATSLDERWAMLMDITWPPLWQKQHKDFMNRDVRQKLFDEIAEKTGLTVDMCKKKLKNLKDKMREVTNKLQEWPTSIREGSLTANSQRGYSAASHLDEPLEYPWRWATLLGYRWRWAFPTGVPLEMGYAAGLHLVLLLLGG